MERAIDDQSWCDYLKSGFLYLGKVLSGDELSALQGRIDNIMLGKIQYEGMMMQLDLGGDYGGMAPQTVGFKGPSLQYRKIEQLEKDPLFLSFMQRPIFREICAHHYGAQADVSCYRAMFMNKPAGQGTELPWHQDGGENWGLDRDPLVTIWAALDPATKANGCVQVIPGSHRLGLVTKYGHTLSKEHVEEFCPDEKLLNVEVEPGHAVLLHNWLIHRSGTNPTNISRRAFSICFIDARTTHLSTGRKFPVIFGENALSVEELNPV